MPLKVEPGLFIPAPAVQLEPTLSVRAVFASIAPVASRSLASHYSSKTRLFALVQSQKQSMTVILSDIKSLARIHANKAILKTVLP
jgi:hypothetical protein